MTPRCLFRASTLNICILLMWNANTLLRINLDINRVGFAVLRIEQILSKFSCCAWLVDDSSSRNTSVGVRHSDQEIGGGLAISGLVSSAMAQLYR